MCVLGTCSNDEDEEEEEEEEVWTDESIQLENHHTFSYRKVKETPRQKARAKHPYKVMVWAGPCPFLQANIFSDHCLSFNVDGVRRCTHYYIYNCIHRCEPPTIDIYSKSPSMTDESNRFYQL